MGFRVCSGYRVHGRFRVYRVFRVYSAGVGIKVEGLVELILLVSLRWVRNL